MTGRLLLLTTLCAAILAAAAPADAAQYTKVVGAFYDDAPFQANVDLFFQGWYKRSSITREYNKGTAMIDAANLAYAEDLYTLVPRLDIGVFRDLEIFVTFPVVLSWTKDLSLDSSTNGMKQFTLNRQNLPNRKEEDAIVKVPGAMDRSGYGDMTVGFKWAIFNDQRPNHVLERDKDAGTLWWDDTTATWLIAFEYTIPTGSQIDPAVPNGGPGKKVQVLTFSTAFSKRFRYLDPYFGVFYSLPFSVGPGSDTDPKYYDYIRPGHKGGFNVGTEIIPYEDHKEGHKFGVDFRLGTIFVSDAQVDHSEMAEFLPGESFFKKDENGEYERDDEGFPVIDKPNDFGRLTATEQYVEFLGQFGLYFVAAKYFKFATNIGFGHDTLHYLTFDKIGTDRNNNGIVSKAEGDIVNPAYEAELDQRGKRLRLSDTFIFFWNICMTGQF
jgi:hypothetical protein